MTKAGVLFTAAVIENGDYIMEDGEFRQCDYIDEVLQDLKTALQVKRGDFYPDSDYGSYLGTLCEEPLDFYAAAYARQALGGFDGVFVKSAKVTPGEIYINLTVNGEERQVTIYR